MNYFCCDDNRRAALKDHPLLNGIDFLEVVDNKSDPDDVRQTVLVVHFINPLAQNILQPGNVIIKGGERITGIKVISLDLSPGSPPFSPLASPPDNDFSRVLFVKLNKAGDFSRYTLRLVQDSDYDDPPAGFDPILSSVEFSFKVLCPNDFDCSSSQTCATEIEAPPDINYLAKDYASFRQLMLDRMALLVPQWRERNPADFGIVLVELLAYAGDYLSYRQDAIATEAYLGTARKRASVRRHVRLVDYFMHDGSNARTWAHIKVKEGIQNLLLKKIAGTGEKTKMLTRRNGLPVVFKPDNKEFERIIGKKKDPLASPGDKEFDFTLPQDLQIFELLHDVTLDTRHNEMNFYTWLDENCCLPKGTTSATLDGHFPALQPGQVLIFAEIAGPVTGKQGDADPLHRHAVQLINVALTEDPIGNRPVTKITWHKEDALPFPLCVSSTTNDGITMMVSVAYGNNVLVDHGFTIYEKLPHVPVPGEESPELNIIQVSDCSCEKPEPAPVPVRYRPALKRIPLTQWVPYDNDNPPVSASSARSLSLRDSLPFITLQQQNVEGDWMPQRDLLDSKHNDEHFVVEVESDGMALLRFGNGIEGERPQPATEFTAVYRVGNGISGNIGAGSLCHLISDDPAINGATIAEISNPLAAIGGVEQENIETVRRHAPIAFRSRQERAVTLADYEEVSKRCDADIQRSAASLRWTGSWRTVFISVDKLGGKKVDQPFEEKLRNGIEKYRMAGHDLEVDDPLFVSLDIEMTVCVDPNYFRSDVKLALLEKFGNKLLANGKRGVFHPDNFSFGQPVYLSPVYTAAQETEGVTSVRITKFQRQGRDDNKAMDDGMLLLGRFEIARLDNDPNFPEHGVFKLDIQGGK